MALYRFEAKIIGRSGGKSTLSAAAYRSGQTATTRTATSAAAYRHGSVITDERTGVTYDYTRKRGVGGGEILVPENAPAWASERERLWNEVEQVERRKDSQLARDFVISFPHELDQTQRRNMLVDFLGRNFVDRGYVCDVAYHLPHGKGDDRNHHAHVMVPTRTLDQGGFNRTKERPDGNPVGAWKEELAGLREDWATTMNRHLEAAGRPERVSHLSLVDRGIDRMPEPKQGPLATQIEREGRESNAGNDRRRVKAENDEREAIANELNTVVSLAIEAMKRGKMDEPSEIILEAQAKRQADALAALQEHDERLTAFKKQREAEAEEARKREQEREEREKEQRDKQSPRKANDDITSAGTRYDAALAEHYDEKAPYSTLAAAAMAEWTSFKGQQDELRKQAEAEKDAEKRKEIELRRKIEGHEYMSTTSHRLADMTATIVGREDAPLAVLDRQRAQANEDQANRLREQRAEIQQSRDKAAKEQDQEHSQSRPTAERSGTEKSDKASEVTDAKAAKLARLQETNDAYRDHSEAKERQGGRGGRG